MSADESREGLRLAPVLFATSNLGKFVQARLVFQQFGLDIEQLQAHSEPYQEPYGTPTEDFLRAGLGDVVRRAGRGRLVFIEDTTAYIPALGGGGSLPGQRTKEWFDEKTHEELVATITREGDWSATVRSDIALYVPTLGHVVFFRGESSGHIVRQLPKVSPNPLYPWLGQADFSSWFQPDQASRVLAEMTYEESTLYDFRHQALSFLVARLLEYQAARNLEGRSLLRSSPSGIGIDQLPLLPRPGERLLVAVVGPTAVGKTTAGHFLSLHRDFTHIEAGIALQRLAASLDIDGRTNLELADRVFSDYGRDAVEKMLVWPMFRDSGGPLVYTGCRTREGLLFLRQRADEAGVDLRIVAVSAPEAVRYGRSLERARATMASVHDFEEVSKRDAEFGAVGLAPSIARARIRNVGSLESFFRRVDRAVVP